MAAKGRRKKRWKSLGTWARAFPAGSPAQIALHGCWQIQKGRNPSCVCQSGERNPRLAFAQALAHFNLTPTTVSAAVLREYFRAEYLFLSLHRDDWIFD